jgi:nucleoside-diphosphate-sugar epimerase
MTKSLVAGVAGFLGSNLATELLNRGHSVLGVDNFATSDNRNLQELKENPNFQFRQMSITDAAEVASIETVDYIFHFASPASPPKYQKLGLETIKVNTVGTENLIELALTHSARLIYASTSEVYGDPLVSPQPESYWGNVNPIGPRSVYDEAKRLGETLIALYCREKKLDAGIVRIFNTYGPGMDPFDGRVVSTFIRQALRSEPLTVFGDGSQTRSFCFVDDLIDGILRMSDTKLQGPVNLGNPLEINLITLGEIISKSLGLEPVFNNLPLPEDDPKQRRPDISLAKKLLGWEPKVSLELGLAQTAEWIKERMHP